MRLRRSNQTHYLHEYLYVCYVLTETAYIEIPHIAIYVTLHYELKAIRNKKPSITIVL